MLVVILGRVELVCDLFADGVRLFLRRLFGLRHFRASVLVAMFRGIGLTLYARFLSLNDMRELVREQLVSVLRTGLKLARVEVDVLPTVNARAPNPCAAVADSPLVWTRTSPRLAPSFGSMRDRTVAANGAPPPVGMSA